MDVGRDIGCNLNEEHTKSAERKNDSDSEISRIIQKEIQKQLDLRMMQFGQKAMQTDGHARRNQVSPETLATEPDVPNELEGNDQLQTKNSRAFRLIRISGAQIRTVFAVFLCTCGFSFFFYHSLIEFLEKRPISITTLTQIANDEASVSIKICNNADLDPELVEIHFKSDSEPNENASLRQLYQGAHTETLPLKTNYFFKTEVYEKARLGIEKFVVGCQLTLSSRSCLLAFKPLLDITGVCYQADLNTLADKTISSVTIDFYFDPAHYPDHYVPNHGAFVAVNHPSSYVNTFDGFFMSPRQQTDVSATIVNKVQTTSFPKSECTHKYGLKRYNFTGIPFETSYNSQSCFDICVAEEQYKNCNCSMKFGWNITNTDCVFHSEKNDCLVSNYRNLEMPQKLLNYCTSKCTERCDYRIMETRVLSIYQPLKGETMRSYLKHWVTNFDNVSFIANRLSDQIKSSSDLPKTLESVSENYSRLSFRLQNQMKVIETIPLITFSTFMANSGGLVGMWLGISVLFVAELLQGFVNCIWMAMQRYL